MLCSKSWIRNIFDSPVGVWPSLLACFTNSLCRIASCVLFATLATSHNLFRSHLLGTSRDPIPPPVQPMESILSYPMPPGYGKHTPEHSRNNSITSILSRRSSILETLAVMSRPLSRTTTSTTEPQTYNPVGFPIERPMSTDPMAIDTRSSISRANNPYGFASRQVSAYSAMTRSSTSLGNHPYQHRRVNNSMSSLPGFNPLSPIIRPTPSILSETAFKAIHPPATHFRHVSSVYSPVARPGTSLGFSALRSIPNSPQLGLGGRKTPSMHSAYGNRGHARSQSAGVIPTYPSSFTPIAPTYASSRSSSSGSGSLPRSGLNNMRRAINPDDIVVHVSSRIKDMDMAIRLERKLAEVQATLERKASQNSSDSGSNYTENGEMPGPLFITKSRSAVELTHAGFDFDLPEHRRFASAGLLDAGGVNRE